MKRILTALILAGIMATSCLAKISETEKSTQAGSEDTKYICTIGLEGEGSLTEYYKDKEECAALCKGGAVVCQKTAKKNSQAPDDVD